MFDSWGPFNPLTLIRRLLQNPLALFIYSFLSKWYLMVVVGSVIVTYWVFKGLNDAGVITAAETVLTTAIEQTKGVAQNCIPRIKNLQDFWSCLNDPAMSIYRTNEQDQQFEKDMKGLMRIDPGTGQPQSDTNSGSGAGAGR